jgi:uncharacterized protein YbjT (DUF2867 family)
MSYLITGATGNIGGRVALHLLERGERPRVLVRDAEKARARFGDRVDVMVGDLADAASLSAALDGVDALLLVTTGRDIEARDEAAAKAAKAAGVQRLVKLSSMDVQRKGGATVGAWHARGEAAIRASGIAFTFVQPAGFMSNALAWATSIRADGVVRASTGNGRVAMIHPDDIAAVATKALVTREHEGESLPITGPEALSYAEMTAKIGAAIGKPLTFQPISDAEAKERMLASGAPAPVCDALVSLWRAIREGTVAAVTENVDRALGRRPLSFDRWASENRLAYR